MTVYLLNNPSNHVIKVVDTSGKDEAQVTAHQTSLIQHIITLRHLHEGRKLRFGDIPRVLEYGRLPDGRFAVIETHIPTAMGVRTLEILSEMSNELLIKSYQFTLLFLREIAGRDVYVVDTKLDNFGYDTNTGRPSLIDFGTCRSRTFDFQLKWDSKAAFDRMIQGISEGFAKVFLDRPELKLIYEFVLRLSKESLINDVTSGESPNSELTEELSKLSVSDKDYLDKVFRLLRAYCSSTQSPDQRITDIMLCFNRIANEPNPRNW